MVDIGKVSLAKYFADAIITSAKRKADIFINFMLRRASSQYQRPKLKNPRNPENPDSKPMRNYPSTNKLYFQSSDVIINPQNPVNPDSN